MVSEILFRYEAIECNNRKKYAKIYIVGTKIASFLSMSLNRISGNDSALRIAQNNATGGENSVLQGGQNFNVDGKTNKTFLAEAFDTINRMVTEKTKPGLKNFWKNFWNRERKQALMDTKAALDILKDENGNFTLGKLEYNTGLFNEALNNKGLSKASRDALENLVKELKAETSYFKTTYSEDQLKEMYYSISKNKSNLLGEGSFGKVYAGKNGLVFKVIQDQEAFTKDINGNEAFQNGANNFTNNKEFFYRQSNGLVTEYVGSFQEDGQNIAVFERVHGMDMDEVLQNQNDNLIKTQPQQLEKTRKSINLQRCIMLSQMAEGIAAIHEAGCINRDIKPQNAMVGYRETEEPARDENGNIIMNNGKIQMKTVKVPYVKLIDQGLAIDMKSGKGLKGCCGTPGYVAPETALKLLTPPACDVFSFGITLLESTGNSETNEITNKLAEEVHIAFKNNFQNHDTLEVRYQSLSKDIDACYPNKEKNNAQKYIIITIVIIVLVAIALIWAIKQVEG